MYDGENLTEMKTEKLEKIKTQTCCNKWMKDTVQWKLLPSVPYKTMHVTFWDKKYQLNSTTNHS